MAAPAAVAGAPEPSQPVIPTNVGISAPVHQTGRPEIPTCVGMTHVPHYRLRMSPPTRPFWLSVFFDLPEAVFDSTVGFWSAVTGYSLSPLRGDHQEFGTLLPPAGDDYLRVQRVGDDVPRLHLDVHVPDPDAAATRAIELGAAPLADPGLGYRVLRSPGGLTFCLVTHASHVRPPAVTWPDRNRSLVDQVALDLPQDAHDDEAAFWSALFHAPVQRLSNEFSAIDRRPELPVRVLLQRLDEPSGPTRAHLDLATDDVAAEVARHLGLGAEHVRDHDEWTVLRDPSGLAYCVTEGIRSFDG